MGFNQGKSSIQTIATLFKMNGILSYITNRKFKCIPYYISANTARKTCGIKLARPSKIGKKHKEQVFDYMCENDLSYVNWPVKRNGKAIDWAFDATDSYVIARAYEILNCKK